MAGTLSRRAFTLIELLTVIIIIAIIIGITVPAIGLVRDSAKAVDTKALISSIVTASSAFQTDHQGKLPGYFSARDMGSVENRTRGMSNMENVILDLAGAAAIVKAGTPGALADVGPIAASSISIDPALIGTGDSQNKAYLTLNKKFFVAQLQGTQQVSASGSAAAEGAPQIPDMVDSWGQPLLAWTADDPIKSVRAASPSTVTNPNDGIFAADSVASGNNARRAVIYYNQNRCFLDSASLGKKGISQIDESLISSGNSSDYLESLAGALGSPAAPYKDPNNATNAPTVALKARGGLIIQSAGRDGVYLGKKDRGAKQFPTPRIDYQFNFVNKPGGKINNAVDQWNDKNGKPTTIDVLDKFDDLWGTVLN